MLESQIERYFCKEIKKLGGWALKFTPSGTRGWPDRLVLFPGGRAVFAELKAPGEKPSPLQRKRARELWGLGFGAIFIDSYQGVDTFIELWSREVKS